MMLRDSPKHSPKCGHGQKVRVRFSGPGEIQNNERGTGAVICTESAGAGAVSI